MNGQNTPMSDERLEAIREVVIEEPNGRVPSSVVADLLAEVGRLKSEHRDAVMLTLIYQTEREEATDRADRAEAKLARVAGKHMADLLVRTVRQDDRHREDVEAEVQAIISAVAYDEQAEEPTNA